MIREHQSSRVRAVLRGLLPAVVTLAVLTAWRTGLVPAAVVRATPVAERFGVIFVQTPGYLLAIGLALVIAVRLDRRPLREFGLNVDGAWIRDFVVGVAISLVAIAVSAWYGLARGVIELDTAAVDVGTADAAAILAVGLVVFIGFNLIQNVYEELVYRGIMLQNFAEGLTDRGLSPRWAVVLATAASTVAFGAFHLPTGGPIVAVDAMFVGIPFALAYLLTGNLGLAIGVHFGRTPINILYAPGAEAVSPFGLSGILEFTALGTDVEVLNFVVVCGLLLVWSSVAYGGVSIAETVYQRSDEPADVR